MTPDVNILVAAARRDHPFHQAASTWLVEAQRDSVRGKALLLLPVVMAGTVRIVTNRRVFKDPTPIAQALAFIEAIVEAEGVEIAEQRPDWRRFSAICLEHQLSGNDITDAAIAADVLTHHDTLVTFDAGFRRFLGGSSLVLLPR